MIAKNINGEVDLISSVNQVEIPYSYFQLSPSKQFDLNYNVASSNLITKIVEKSLHLDEIAEVKDGVIQSKVADILFLRSRINEYSKPLLFGKDVTKYHVNFDGNYINYNYDEVKQVEIERVGSTTVGLRLREPKIFERKKILTRQTADRIIGAIDENNYYYANTLHGTHITDERYSYEFVLGILNSKLMNWFYKTITSEGGKVFAQVKIAILQKLPIPKYELIQEEKISQFVEQLCELVKKQSKLLSESNDFLNAELNITSSSSNIFNHGWNGLQEILESKKIKLAVEKREELFRWFKEKQTELNNLNLQINKLSGEIDMAVYKIYNLTEEEIKIIEDSLITK